MNTEDLSKLRQREADLLSRIERMKKTMNETQELDTLARQAKLFREAQEELRRVQEQLAGLPPEDGGV